MQNIQLFHGDCMEVMKGIPDKSIDMVLCDPPYGTTILEWDQPLDLDKLWKQYERIIKDNGAIVLFAQTPYDKILGCSNLKLLRYEWIWEKPQATGHLNCNDAPMKSHENILIFYKKLPTFNPQKTQNHKPVNKFKKTKENQNRTKFYNLQEKEYSGGGSTERYPRSVLLFPSDKQKLNCHETQKPLALLGYLIETYTNENDIILDNCMGSGGTGVAAKYLNRKFIGIEITEKYFKIAKRRLNGEIFFNKTEEPGLNYKLPGFE